MKLADILKASAARVKSNEEAEDYVGGRANLAELVRGSVCATGAELLLLQSLAVMEARP